MKLRGLAIPRAKGRGVLDGKPPTTTLIYQFFFLARAFNSTQMLCAATDPLSNQSQRPDSFFAICIAFSNTVSLGLGGRFVFDASNIAFLI